VGQRQLLLVIGHLSLVENVTMPKQVLAMHRRDYQRALEILALKKSKLDIEPARIMAFPV
jgi:hypothetical protein